MPRMQPVWDARAPVSIIEIVNSEEFRRHFQKTTGSELGNDYTIMKRSC